MPTYADLRKKHHLYCVRITINFHHAQKNQYLCGFQAYPFYTKRRFDTSLTPIAPDMVALFIFTFTCIAMMIATDASVKKKETSTTVVVPASSLLQETILSATLVIRIYLPPVGCCSCYPSLSQRCERVPVFCVVPLRMAVIPCNSRYI